jgi:WD40 repeat protein
MAVAFDSNYMLASGSNDKTIKLWDKNSGGLLRTLEGHGEGVRTVAFDSTHLLASGSDDNTIKI